ncbi:hypothetical protein [Urbifossiella limnaea]|uniref:Uncharacterized protein n=1 Tax=Urbifossiella limnaea TaxID=2528023 RepID=A0A517Y206_9BACT|nr:hypothetical protein [Urbifossiella limnaea]QDU23738.1 hypothetical protein ETAA1_57450 [Urbifossiella limnaea]
MGTFLAIYVRVPVAPHVSHRLARYGEAVGEPGSDFCGVELSVVRYQTAARGEFADLAALSTELDTNALLLGFCGITNWFRFGHWRAGRRLRALESVGGDSGSEWKLDEGAPEPWEPESFGALRAGRLEQDIDAHGAAESAARFYRLPGWA